MSLITILEGHLGCLRRALTRALRSSVPLRSKVLALDVHVHHTESTRCIARHPLQLARDRVPYPPIFVWLGDIVGLWHTYVWGLGGVIRVRGRCGTRARGLRGYQLCRCVSIRGRRDRLFTSRSPGQILSRQSGRRLGRVRIGTIYPGVLGNYSRDKAVSCALEEVTVDAAVTHLIQGPF